MIKLYNMHVHRNCVHIKHVCIIIYKIIFLFVCMFWIGPRVETEVSSGVKLLTLLNCAHFAFS